MVSALTFRVLHGSREMALALVGISQELAVVDEALAAIAHAARACRTAPTPSPRAPRAARSSSRTSASPTPGGRVVFDRFSLSIPAGQKVGLVGASGAGKSTLVGLRAAPGRRAAGRILIDGQPLTDVTQDSLRAAIAVVPQEVSLFHRSILENIRYGRPGASDDEVVAAARAACADEFIRALPDGYADDDRRARHQALRRPAAAAGHRPRDPEGRADPGPGRGHLRPRFHSPRRRSRRRCARLMQGRTVLAIAHRLSTLAALDRIIVLADGRIVEDGAPGELLRTGGVFQTLWRLQADSFAAAKSRRAAA